ncbi:S41 family peptidase [Croceitalea rosinachiae]|uniref:S41 family peptidase n=1 Tax=Croceitalea rosinachiae TaxID=3075596 RepID=A0ABU3ABB1_9FLAO|nr:S41 family peptidase [Croceitalea sp. F388]MDT0607203.1 S41 family peptidase [Croceitalea sp. F388]
MRKTLFLFIGLGLLLNACNNDDDNGLNPTSAEVTVQNFMWQAMNEWYFWQEDVADLADNRFVNNQEYTEYLQAGGDPESFIESLLFAEDRFTFYNKDFEVLLNSLSGIQKSNGLQTFSVDLLSDNSDDNRFLFVRNVIPGSDAANQGIKRGDVFYGVDGVQFTSQNISDLLSPDTYTLNRGELDVVNRLVNTTYEEVTITKEENFLEPPIRLATTLDINGTKIGYLMYQRFNSDFNEELNDVFGQFVADGVTDLVLDMRYNPGGSVNTSRLLASMIYGTNTNELYIRQRWNNKQQARFSDAQLEDFFADQVSTGMPLNSLNLSRVFVLATGSSASASELIMNGLDPYVEVVHIGTTTRGKNEFSISLVDDPDNRYSYTPSRVDNINPDNKWIIQPLVGRNENSVGFIDYTAGFSPDFELREDVFDLGSFGDPNEPLLARAIEEITNVSSKSLTKEQFSKSPNEVIEIDSQERGIMILDKSLQ